MTPAVSVIIATYNYGRYLGGAIASALGQTFQDLEVIVIDDGSTDNTPQVITPFLAEARLRYVRTENHGQPAAENVGIRLSQGPWIAFLDADDLWLPHKLERQLALTREDPELGVVYSRRLMIDSDGRPLAAHPRSAFRGYVLKQMFRDNFVCFSSSVVNRDVFDLLGPFNEQYRHASDYDMWLRAGLHYRFDYVDEPLVSYRTGHANLTSRGDVQLLTALTIMNRFLQEHPGQLDRAWVRQCYQETYGHLGLAVRDRSRLDSAAWQIRALAKGPWNLGAWKEMAKLLLPGRVERWLRGVVGRAPPAGAGRTGGRLWRREGRDTGGSAVLSYASKKIWKA